MFKKSFREMFPKTNTISRQQKFAKIEILTFAEKKTKKISKTYNKIYRKRNLVLVSVL